jgi:hypothetical protein
MGLLVKYFIRTVLLIYPYVLYCTLYMHTKLITFRIRKPESGILFRSLYANW